MANKLQDGKVTAPFGVVAAHLPVSRSVWMLFFLCILPVGLMAQNISNYYVQSNQGSHKLFFVYPQEGFKESGHGNKLVHDMTFLDTQKEVTFNFTFTHKEALTIDSISFLYDTHCTTYPVNKIYVESKSKWVYRMGVQMDFQVAASFWACPVTPRIRLSCGEKAVELRMKRNRWKELSTINTRIFEVILLN